MERKLKHLEFIQGTINRLSQNSFLLKGWSVVLAAALMAIAAKDSNKTFIYLALFPAITFWILDGYFLHQEKLFRKLYEKVSEYDKDNIDFSMDTSIIKREVLPWRKCVHTVTLLLFHGAIIISILIVGSMIK